MGGVMSSLIPAGSASGTGSVTLQPVNTNNNRTVTFPDATGTVLVSGNQPAFSAYYAGTSQTVSGSTWTKATLDTEVFDTNNNFASSRFTPTVAGYYYISGVVRCTSSVTFSRYIVGIWKNGSEYYRGSETNFTSGLISQTQTGGSCIVYLNGSTDYVELYGYITGTGTLTFANDGAQAYTQSMTGCLVRAA